MSNRGKRLVDQIHYFKQFQCSLRVSFILLLVSSGSCVMFLNVYKVSCFLFSVVKLHLIFCGNCERWNVYSALLDLSLICDSVLILFLNPAGSLNLQLCLHQLRVKICISFDNAFLLRVYSNNRLVPMFQIRNVQTSNTML